VRESERGEGAVCVGEREREEESVCVCASACGRACAPMLSTLNPIPENPTHASTCTIQTHPQTSPHLPDLPHPEPSAPNRGEHANVDYLVGVGVLILIS